MFLVPSAPYAKGGHHLSNGATWIEQLGQTLKLNRSNGPAWRNPGVFTNYAVDAARARDDGLNVNLGDQVAAFAEQETGELLDGALVVLWVGSNDVRDAAVSGGDPGIIAAAITAIQDNILVLYGMGARDFLIGNSPDIGLIPSIRMADVFFPGLAAGATALSVGFNDALTSLLDALESGLPGVSFTRLDSFSFLQDAVAGNLGLVNTMDACIMPGVPPYSCRKPDDYLFWDGVHPTKAGHALLAEYAHSLLAP
jgi:outer membrane lipase/esterase